MGTLLGKKKRSLVRVCSIGEGQEFGNTSTVPPFINLEFGQMLIFLLEM